MKHLDLKHKALALILLFGLLTTNTIQVFANTDAWNGTVLRPNKGSGTIDDPYLITSAEEFAFLVQNYDYNLGVCLNKYYKLTTDIDMASCKWTYGVAYTDNKSFRANFNGDGHKISNIIIPIRTSTHELHVGLFPEVGGDEDFESAIENVVIDGITFELDNNGGSFNCTIGGIVGQLYGNSRIENCRVNNINVTENGKTIDASSISGVKYDFIAGSTREKFGDTTDQEQLESIKIVDCQGTETVYTAHATIKEMPSDASGRHFKATVTGTKPARLRWTVDGKAHQSTTTECTVPFDAKDRSIAFEALDAKGTIIASAASLIEPAELEIKIDAVKAGAVYTLKSKIVGEGDNSLSSEFQYSWIDLSDNNKEVGTKAILANAKAGHTYILNAHHRRWKFCALSAIYSLCDPIFVNHNGISANDAKKYTFDGTTTYAQGNDANDGKSPEKAVRTLKRAYELLSSEDLDKNVIVIMGDYNQPVFNYYTDDSYKSKNSDYFEKNKNAIITGQYGNIRSGKLLMHTSSNFISADTRFEDLTLHGMNDEGIGNAAILAQEHNLTFGYGIEMTQYNPVGTLDGLIDGTQAPNFNIFGGYMNPNDENKEHKPFTIKVQSGYYSRIIAGSRYTKLNTKTGNVEGNPKSPLQADIVIDISNYKNPYGNTFDVALVAGGQVDGSVYAVSDIDIIGTSRVGRAVGGNIGYGRNAWIESSNGDREGRPSDSFFGQSTINFRSGNINEIYGANLGRCGNLISDESELCDTIATYFYGKSIINLEGGTVRNTIYGAGGGGITGLAYDDEHHSFDPYIPYYLNNGNLAYGNYKKAREKMPKVVVTQDSLIDLEKTSVTINVSGKAHLRGTIYGGGHGFSNQVNTCTASCQAGNLYGDSYVNISGGTVDGYVYGGGNGTTCYFDNNDRTGYPVIDGNQVESSYFSSLATVNGSTNINITGGAVNGMVYGGGEGSYYRATSESDPTNITDKMACVVGYANISISGDAELDDFVFGGGNYADIIRSEEDFDSGSTNVTVSGGHIKNSIFGGGHGHVDKRHPERSIVANIDGDTHVTISGGEFVWVDNDSRYADIRYYGIYGGGNTSSIINGNTYVNVSKSLFSKDFIKASNVFNSEFDRPWDKRFTICGGGYGDMADVEQNTYVTINSANASDRFLDVFGGGLIGNVEGSSNVTINGNAQFRNVYGGGLVGHVGLSDMYLNGGLYSLKDDVRDYNTNSNVTFLSGKAENVFGGGLIGNICGETFVTIGSNEDAANNKNINITNVYAGSDATGSIAGGNNSAYGTNLFIYGGNINGDVYGSGNGLYGKYDLPSSEFDAGSLQNASIGRERPHVASTSINISGVDKNNKANIKGNVYLGGNNTTVGVFTRDSTDHSEFGMLREVLIPNTGRARINIGNHVSLGGLVMGCNGSHLLDFIPYYSEDGQNWTKGFKNNDAFQHFCRNVDFSCVPQLTFNADGSFNNEHIINDLYGDQKEFVTGDEMNAEDITIGKFVGGGHTGSMTADELYLYTLPTGVTITGDIIGGCLDAHLRYVETEGVEKDSIRDYVGGFIPYDHNISQYHRLQLNIFCKFAPMKQNTDKAGHAYYSGSNIFGGCYGYGVIYGAASINMHSDMIGSTITDPKQLQNLAYGNTECCQIYGGGKGENTEVIGSSYLTLSGATLNGKKTFPNVLNAYGGGFKGIVVGKSNIVCDMQAPGATPHDAVTHAVWGDLYGGGRMGDVVKKSKLIADAFATVATGSTNKVYSGQVGKVFGGSKLANIEGGTMVIINDKGKDHFHTIIGKVYGGSDICGTIGTGSFRNSRGKTIESNTYINILESQKTGSTVTGFPLIGDVYAGGNGDYGVHGQNETYAQGEVFAQDGNIALNGKALPDVESAYLDINGGTICNVYAGADNCTVSSTSIVDIDYPTSYQSALFDKKLSPECYNRGKTTVSYLYDDGFTDDNTSIKLKNNIFRIYKGNKQTDMTVQPSLNLYHGNVGTTVDGSNKASNQAVKSQK